MAYYNGKKVLSVVKTDQAQFPTYEGSYTITANGTYPTAYKAFVDNLVVNVPNKGWFEKTAQDALNNRSGWNYMFYTSSSSIFSELTDEALAELDFSVRKPTNTAYMFAYCEKLKSVPIFDTSEATSMRGMFVGCKALENIPLFVTSSCRDFGSMFQNCNALKEIPNIDTSHASDMDGFVSSCHALKVIPAVKAGMNSESRSFTNINGCENVEEIHATEIRWKFDIHYSTKFTREALIEIIGNLVQNPFSSSVWRLTMGATNLAKLTEEDISVATAKGWTIS